MARPRSRASTLIEPLNSDLVALAQTHALDISTFPHSSLPLLMGGAGAVPLIWIARSEDTADVIGFVATRPRGERLEISGLAVEAKHRRSGIGRALVRAAVRSARQRGFELVSLHVSTGNRQAVTLYLDEGFRIEQRLSGFYRSDAFPDHGDAWLMMHDVERE